MFETIKEKFTNPLIKYGSIALGTVLLLCGIFYAGYSMAPEKVITKTEIQWKEKIVEVVKEVNTQHTQNNVVTVKITRIKPDGTTEIEERTVDTSTTDIVIDESHSTVTENSGTSTTITTVSKVQKDWHVSVLAGYNFSKNIEKDYLIPGQYVYGVQIERRIIFESYIGIFGLTDKTIGVSLGLHL